MYTYKYPRPAVTADIVLLDPAEHRVLLIRRGNEPFRDCWAFPGGFFDMEDPSIEHTAQRELQEETGLSNIELRLACIASRPGRDPRGRTLSAVYVGHVDPSAVTPRGGDDAKEARWFDLSQLPPLAFDHAELIAQLLPRK